MTAAATDCEFHNLRFVETTKTPPGATKPVKTYAIHADESDAATLECFMAKPVDRAPVQLERPDGGEVCTIAPKRKLMNRCWTITRGETALGAIHAGDKGDIWTLRDGAEHDLARLCDPRSLRQEILETALNGSPDLYQLHMDGQAFGAMARQLRPDEAPVEQNFIGKLKGLFRDRDWVIAFDIPQPASSLSLLASLGLLHIELSARYAASK